jgi:hypothetical protein
MKNKQNKKQVSKTIVWSQIISLIIEIFAISFIIGGMSIGISPQIEAQSFAPQGCCTETKNGEICQNMNLADKTNCKTSLLSTDCSNVDECMSGCCFDSSNGLCSLNSPKAKCTENGGNWSYNPACMIQECVLGCCVLGDNAAQTTLRECSLMSRQLDITQNFQPLDADGSCNTKIGLSNTGACVRPSDDFSGENNCKFTTKEKCIMTAGTFYEDYLCTSKELKTTCFKAKNTTCLPDKDQVYYVDSCGNPANIYDASKYNEDSYWEKVISPSESCLSRNADCGNCNYLDGSFCQDYRKNKDEKPSIGNKICRDLNCLNGRKHGESWCVYDYPFSGDNILPVGSRYFVGSCMDGEIRITPCADFNQEICVQKELQDKSKVQAKCMVNPWRSCLLANIESTYSQVKSKCEENEYCMLFNEYYLDRNAWWPANAVKNMSSSGTSNNTLLTRSDGQMLAGFDNSIVMENQGAAGNVGKSANSQIPWCVPKYAPGFVFWQDAGSNASSSLSYGGSYTESKYICNLGNFVCTSKKQRSCSLSATWQQWTGVCVLSTIFGGNPDCGDWQDKENWECNINGEYRTAKTDEIPKLVAAYNERCRAIGSCGVNTNIAGEKGVTNRSFIISRAKIDLHGDQRNMSIQEYALPEEYLATLPAAITKIIKLADIQEISSILGLSSMTDSSVTPRGNATSTATTENVRTSIETERTAAQANVATSLSNFGMYSGALSLISFAYFYFFPVSAFAATVPVGATFVGAPLQGGVTYNWGSPSGGIGGTLAGAAIGAMAGYYLGKAIIKNQHWSPGHEKEFMEVIMATAATIGAVAGFFVSYMLSAAPTLTAFCSTGYGCVISVIIVIVLIIYSVYESCYGNSYNENEYYIIQSTCGPWQAPSGGNSCDLCNDDIRACSEYRCKSLGATCVYNNGNGEPGICTDGSGDWASATITPYENALSSGLKYDNIQESSFGIKSNASLEVPAYTTVEFGVQTDKLAQCRIDNKHTDSFDAMAVAMEIDTDYECETASCGNQGNYHKVALSPYIPEAESGSATLGLKQGENQFYIRCRNYMGQWNRAEFTVKVMVAEGPDKTPPNIKSFNPASGLYLKMGTTSSSFTANVDEPAECKYAVGNNSGFEDMNNTMRCSTDSASAILGTWPCFASLNNLVPGENKIYVQCKDHPELADRSDSVRNLNRRSSEFVVNVCSTGLNITSVSPEEQIIIGKSPLSATIQVTTSGCIDNGKSICSYKTSGMPDSVYFLKTDSNVHSQTFTNLMPGSHNITVICEDEAGNSDNKSLIINVLLDNAPPFVLKSYYLDNRKLVVLTDEESSCRYTTNSSLGCFFNFDEDNSTLMTGEQKYHEGYWRYTENYYIKCRDKFNNTNLNCGVQIRTY